jgi:hypothetical protein
MPSKRKGLMEELLFYKLSELKKYNCFLGKCFLNLLKEKAGSRYPEVRMKTMQILVTSDFGLQTSHTIYY